MADPGAATIMLGGIDDRDASAHLFSAVDKFSALSGVNVLAGKRCEKPGGAFEKIGIGKLYAGVFFARHGMPAEESLPGGSPKRFRSALNNFHLRAANVGHECLCKQRWPHPLDHL